MAPRPIKRPSQNTIRFALGALLTVQQFAKIMLAGRKEPRMCPKCAYRMVEPAGKRWAGRGKPWVHAWQCHSCRANYESHGADAPFRTPGHS